MKYLIASDLHGDADAVRALLAAYEREGADQLVLLGDLLYHGPRNDLPTAYRPKEVIALLNAHKEQILCVRGNCDAEVDQMVLEFPIMADYAVLTTESGHKVYLTHGHRFHEEAPLPMGVQDLMMHGHTHVSGLTACRDGQACINPGSVSMPKNGTPKGYAVLEGDTVRLCHLQDGETYFAHKIG